MLTFLDYYAPIIVDVLSEVCGRHLMFPSCHGGGHSLIQSDALLLVIFASLKKQV